MSRLVWRCRLLLKSLGEGVRERCRYSMIFQSSMRLVWVEKLTPILNIFLESCLNGMAYPFSSICCNAEAAELLVFSSKM